MLNKQKECLSTHTIQHLRSYWLLKRHRHFLDRVNNTQNMKVSLNNLLSDHLIILSYPLSDNLIMKKILKQLYQERKSTLGYILQKENFWNTSNEFLEDYILSIHRNIRSFLRNLKFKRDVFIWKYRFNIVRMQLESCMLDKWILTYL